MAKQNVNDVLVSVMTDLNLTYTTEELLDENLLDYLKGAGRKVANGARDAGFCHRSGRPPHRSGQCAILRLGP